MGTGRRQAVCAGESDGRHPEAHEGTGARTVLHGLRQRRTRPVGDAPARFSSAGRRFLSMDWFPLLLSLRVALLATIITAALGVPAAWLLARRHFAGRDLISAALLT